MTSTHTQDPRDIHGGTATEPKPKPVDDEEEQPTQPSQPQKQSGEKPVQQAPPSAHDNPSIVNGKQVVFPNAVLLAPGQGQGVPIGPHSIPPPATKDDAEASKEDAAKQQAEREKDTKHDHEASKDHDHASEFSKKK